jgi:CRISPR-associated exonuclease Cas4
MQEIIDKAVENFLQRVRKERDENVFYPSEIGFCIRRNWFIHKRPKDLELELLKIFESGNLIHNWFKNVLFNAYTKDIISEFRYEEPLVFKEDFEIRGKFDDMISLKVNGEQKLIEVKTVRDIHYADKVKKHHFMQINFYLSMLNLDKGYVIYIDRKDLKYKVFEVKTSKEVFNEMVKRARQLHEHLKNNKIPFAEAKFDKDREWECSYCVYRKECQECEKD